MAYNHFNYSVFTTWAYCKDFTTIHLLNGKKLLISEHLGTVQRMLPDLSGSIALSRSRKNQFIRYTVI